jgi:hypothetical protein
MIFCAVSLFTDAFRSSRTVCSTCVRSGPPLSGGSAFTTRLHRINWLLRVEMPNRLGLTLHGRKLYLAPLNMTTLYFSLYKSAYAQH